MARTRENSGRIVEQADMVTSSQRGHGGIGIRRLRGNHDMGIKGKGQVSTWLKYGCLSHEDVSAYALKCIKASKMSP